MAREVECPLCVEPLDADDVSFFPCKCGYQVCSFCWHRIRTDENGLCPACRQPYSEDPAGFTPLAHELVKPTQRKRKKRQDLTDVRVIQRDMLFVMGLPERAQQDAVKQLFVKFGTVQRVSIRHGAHSSTAYITFESKRDAAAAARARITLDGKPLKVTFGASKYCKNFLENRPCQKSYCTFLHELGEPEACFTKEEMRGRDSGDWPDRPRSRPPPRNILRDQPPHDYYKMGWQPLGLSSSNPTLFRSRQNFCQ